MYFLQLLQGVRIICNSLPALVFTRFLHAFAPIKITMKAIVFIAIFMLSLFACNNKPNAGNSVPQTATREQAGKDKTVPAAANTKPASAAEIMQKQQVPILCYHAIRPNKANNLYEVNADQFKAQMKALADSGYQTILPNQLYAYLNFGASLPDKPVMITYDDTRSEQFTMAKQEMDKYGFKGVYFIMTISIGRPNYMSREQIKQLSDEGHAVASHTWDHSRFDRYKFQNEKEIRGKRQTVNDYDLQLGDSKKKLEEITGKPVEHFAFPFGLWNAEGIPELQKRDYKLAFQLAAKRDSLQPLYTIRRIIVAPQWSPQQLVQVMKSSFR